MKRSTRQLNPAAHSGLAAILIGLKHLTAAPTPLHLRLARLIISDFNLEFGHHYQIDTAAAALIDTTTLRDTGNGNVILIWGTRAGQVGINVEDPEQVSLLQLFTRRYRQFRRVHVAPGVIGSDI